MLSSKIVVLRRPTREMDRHRFYQNIRNGAKEAKRSTTQRGKKAPGSLTASTEDRDRSPVTLANTGRKTTRFDIEDDLDFPETTKPSGDQRTPRQQQPGVGQQEPSFHRTIYSPRTDRRGQSRQLEDFAGPTSPARSVAGVGNECEEAWKSPGRERSAERSAAEELQGIEDDPPLPPGPLAKESTTNRVTAENRLLKSEMDDVSSQLEMLKNEQEANVQRMLDARRDMEQAERQHRNEIETLKDRMRDVEASKADLVNEVEAQTKKKELIRMENERLRSELERAKGVAEHEQRTAKLREKLEKEKERLEEELDKKTKHVDKLMADNALLKEHCLAAEKDRGFEEELNKVKGKLEKKKAKLVAVRKHADELKKKALSPEQEAELKGKLEKLGSSLKAKDLLLEEAKRERRDTLHEKTDLEANCKDLKDQLKDLHAQLNSAKKTNEELHEDKNHMERDINRLRTENKDLKEQVREEKENSLKLLRFAALEEKIGPLKESIRDRDAKIVHLQRELDTHLQAFEAKIVPLTENIRERDATIGDLQGEIDTLRHAVEAYQKQMDVIRHDPKINTRSPPNENTNHITPDHATAHRRLLDENTRLLTLLDHYRHLATAKPPPIVDDHYHIVRSQAPVQRSNGDLVEAKRQLRSSEERVAQLEKWLDEIYNDKNFQVVPKTQGGRTSLPDLPKRLVMIKASSDNDKKFKNGYMSNRDQ